MVKIFIQVLLAGLLLWGTRDCRAQVTVTVTNRGRVILNNPAGGVEVITSPGPVQIRQRPSGQDQFNAMISSAASIDMESPVVARAEFDPPTVTAGGRVTYRVVINALSESLKLPDELPAAGVLKLVPGARAQNYQPSPGMKLQPHTTVMFHTVAKETGTFVMPGFEVTAYGKPVKVPEARLEVVSAGTEGVREAPKLLLELPDGNIYVGQSLRVKVIMVDPGDGTLQGLSQPKISAESIFSEPYPMSRGREVIQRDGKSYPAFVQEVVITPTREGEQTLVAQASCIMSTPVSGQPGTFSFGNSGSLVDSDPVTMNVKPLPKEGRLEGFTGAVGGFQIESPKLSTNVVRAGDPVTLTVVLRGDGNLGRLTMPSAPMSREWQSFPPIADAATPAFVIQQRGFTSFNYTLIPLSEQVKATPAIPFSYFDPQKEAYVDLTIPPVALTVTPPPAGADLRPMPTPGGPAANSSLPEEREKELVMTGLAEAPGRTAGSLVAWQQRGWFLALQLLPAAGLAGLLYWDNRRRFLEAHPEVILKRRARRGMREQAGLARRAAARQDAAGFVNGALNALREACAPHTAANPDALVCADVLQELPVTDRNGRDAEVVRRLFAAADATRFGGAPKDGAELLALRPEVEGILERLGKRL